MASYVELEEEIKSLKADLANYHKLFGIAESKWAQFSKANEDKIKIITSLNQALKRAHEAMCEASLNLQSDLLFGEDRNPVEILEEAIKEIEKTIGDV